MKSVEKICLRQEARRSHNATLIIHTSGLNGLLGVNAVSKDGLLPSLVKGPSFRLRNRARASAGVCLAIICRAVIYEHFIMKIFEANARHRAKERKRVLVTISTSVASTSYYAIPFSDVCVARVLTIADTRHSVCCSRAAGIGIYTIGQEEKEQEGKKTILVVLKTAEEETKVLESLSSFSISRVALVVLD